MSEANNNNNKESDVEELKIKNDDKPSKIIRFLVVSAYVFSVSFAALALSLYYIFLWSE